jgi:3-oxoacyl-[acyl-carrier protein] reductase
MDLGLAGKVALVTAASRGIGHATAQALAREGAQVVICARDPAALEIAAEQVALVGSAPCEAIRCDLREPAQIESMVAKVVARFGTVHVLVNNAGGPPPGSAVCVTDGDWERAFEMTLMSAVRSARAVLPYMQRQRWGRIVNISSFSVKQPIPELVLSNSLRLGVAGWAKTLAAEVAADNVLVNTVGPGWTRTARVEQMLAARTGATAAMSAVETAVVGSVPLRRMAEPYEIADVIVFLASERASYLTGTLIPVDGGVVLAAL